MREIEYNRRLVKEYAKKWAYLRNPKYYDYENLGGARRYNTIIF